MIERVTNLVHDRGVDALPKHEITQSNFYNELVNLRANRHGGFINDRGFRHIKNYDDLSGFTYAFWLIRKR